MEKGVMFVRVRVCAALFYLGRRMSIILHANPWPSLSSLLHLARARSGDPRSFRLFLVALDCLGKAPEKCLVRLSWLSMKTGRMTTIFGGVPEKLGYFPDNANSNSILESDYLRLYCMYLSWCPLTVGIRGGLPLPCSHYAHPLTP